MKEYVFLTFSLSSFTGGPSYIRNKKKWLEQNGWKVLAFDAFRMSEDNEIDFYELKQFHENYIKELSFLPSWFTNKQRINVLNRVKRCIDKSARTVVFESNTFSTSCWGEYFAREIQAKHLVYVLGENQLIEDEGFYDFFNFKYKQNQLFSITRDASKLLFSKFKTISDSETRFWDSNATCMPENVNMPELQNLEPADFNICHFGRRKNYFKSMIQQFSIFAFENSSKQINFIFFGIPQDPEIESKLIEAKNVKVYFFKSRFPVPMELFRISDVVVATSGCARIAFHSGVKTISMDVRLSHPLGVLGFSTPQTVYANAEHPISDLSLSSLLHEVLISNSYKNLKPVYDLMDSENGYDYQISCVDSPNIYYTNVLKLKGPFSIRRLILFVCVKMNLMSLINYCRFKTK